MNLTITIPAYNEEAAIENTIRNTIEAGQSLTEDTPVKGVHIVVVSDGSTDRTVEIARRFADRIHVEVLPKNRGYGAAIKEGWRQYDDEILGFMDADGTCDPRYFTKLCSTLIEQNADIVLCSRMTAESKMPVLRRIGNCLFSLLLSYFSSRRVKDTASGMRVIRRSALERLLPLPDGMNFTPAMSARALLSGSLKILEIDMEYRERIGKSKLRAFSDGIRFLGSMIEMAFLYRPAKPLDLACLASLLFAGCLMTVPVFHYLSFHSIPDWLIYRFVAANLLLLFSSLMFCASYLTEKMIGDAFHESSQKVSLQHRIKEKYFNGRYFWIINSILLFVGLSMISTSLYDRILYGKTYEHWSKYLMMLMLCSVAIVFMTSKILDYVLSLNTDRKRYFEELSARSRN